MKIAILYSRGEPLWVSSRSIRENLQCSYLKAYPKADTICYEDSDLGHQLVIDQIIQGKYNRLVFLESAPAPLTIFSLLNRKKGLASNMEIHFHIYGDFSLFIPEWCAIFEILKSKKVKFFAASAAQQGFISEFFNKKENIQICPFPIEQKIFHYKKVKDNFRRKLNFDKNDLILVYSGRINYQKGFPILLNWLNRFSTEFKFKSFQLLLLGEFDDEGEQIWKNETPLGRSFNQFQAAIKKMSLDMQSRIHLMGHLSKTEMANVYSASDIFLSLSTYHDEDFGMAPLEALSCGCLALLTGWGGFHGFQIEQNAVRFCPVEISNRGLKICYQDFKTHLLELIEFRKKEKRIEKKIRIKNYQNRFSVEAVAKLLKNLNLQNTKKLSTVSAKINIHASKILLMRQGKRPFKSASKKDAHYFNLYRHYTSGNGPESKYVD